LLLACSGALALALAVACGSGGGVWGDPWLDDRPARWGDRPDVYGWDPLAPSRETPTGAADFPGCAGEPTLRPSELFDLLVERVCEMALRCEAYVPSGAAGADASVTSDAWPPPPEGNAGGAPGSGASSSDPLGSSGCSQLFDLEAMMAKLEKRTGLAAACGLFTELRDALGRHPECDPPVQIPQGACAAALRRCLGDIAALGCNPLAAGPPRSCEGLEFGKPAGGGPDGAGGVGGQSGAGGSTGGSGGGVGEDAGDGAAGQAGGAGAAGAGGAAGSGGSAGAGGIAGQAGGAGAAGSAGGGGSPDASSGWSCLVGAADAGGNCTCLPSPQPNAVTCTGYACCIHITVPHESCSCLSSVPGSCADAATSAGGKVVTSCPP
jgi:hypothetical protein